MSGSTYLPPTIHWLAVAPVACVLGAAVLGVLAEVFVPRSWRRPAQFGLAIVGLALSMVFLVQLWGVGSTAALSYATPGGSLPGGIYLDPTAVFLQGALVVMGGLSLLVLAERADGSLESIAAQPATTPGSLDERAAQAAGMQATEVFPLTMFAIGGMMIFCSAVDLLTMFVGREVFSLPLYIIGGFERQMYLDTLTTNLLGNVVRFIEKEDKNPLDTTLIGLANISPDEIYLAYGRRLMLDHRFEDALIVYKKI